MHDAATRPRRRMAMLALATALAAAGCGIASSTTSAGPGSRVHAVALTEAQVTALAVDGIGTGTVSWWQRPGDPAPHERLGLVSPFAPAADVATVEIVLPEVTDARDGATREPGRQAARAGEVVLRPAWTTRVDNDTDQASRHAFVDTVTVSFLAPGSPGQHPDDEHAAVVGVDATVDVPARACVDVVGLQAWQLDAPEVEEAAGAVQATHLGWLVAEMPCD